MPVEIDLFRQWAKELLEHLMKDHPEGMALYIGGAITTTIVHLVNLREWKIGLKGDNKRWESPEIALYLFFWLFPHILMGDAWLDLHPSAGAWFFMTILLVYGVGGRWGLEWLAKIRGGQNFPADVEKRIDVTVNQQAAAPAPAANPPKINPNIP